MPSAFEDNLVGQWLQLYEINRLIPYLRYGAPSNIHRDTLVRSFAVVRFFDRIRAKTGYLRDYRVNAGRL